MSIFFIFFVLAHGFRTDRVARMLSGKMGLNSHFTGGMKAKGKIVLILGPTASGKTKFGINLCQKLANRNIIAEIVNSDAMQIYKGFDIGTAKPTAAETSAVPHHLVGFLDPREEYNVSSFISDCTRVIEELHASGKLPVLVGGTNLYVEGLLWPSIMDFDEPGATPLESLYDHLDSSFLHDQLSQIDPKRAENLHPNDRKRVIRSLDIYQKYGVTHTELMKRRRMDRETRGIKYNVLAFVLESDPLVHRKRIGERVDEMFERGILEELKEVASLMKGQDVAPMAESTPEGESGRKVEPTPGAESGPEKRMKPKKGIFQSIAYKELMPILTDGDGNLVDSPSQEQLELCKTTLENKTWRYAQRQKTWIRNRMSKNEDLNVNIVDVTNPQKWEQLMDESTDLVIQHLGQNG